MIFLDVLLTAKLKKNDFVIRTINKSYMEYS